MSYSIINTIKKVALEVINEHSLKILFGKVTSVNPLKVRIGELLTLTEEFLVVDVPVDLNDDVIVIKYSNGNKYLVLSTVEKIYDGSSSVLGLGVLGVMRLNTPYIKSTTTDTPLNAGGEVLNGYNSKGVYKSLGKFKITHYCCERYPHICNSGAPYKTATGTHPHVGGCAVDPKIIPLGSYIKINGVVYHAEDTGGAIDGKRIDLVTATHSEALSKGTYFAEVFLKVGD